MLFKLFLFLIFSASSLYWVLCASSTKTNISFLVERTGYCPFEIYATIQSSKYELIEQHMHDVFWRYAEKRIRKWREFFRVRPEIVYEEFLTQAKIAWDGKVLWPDYYQKKKAAPKDCKIKVHSDWLVVSDKVYHFKHKRVKNAKMIIKNWIYVLKKWSTIYPEITHDKNGGIKNLREQRKEYIDNNYKTTKDIPFSSPSAAWAFVYWTASNGQKNWVDDDWVTLGDNLKKGL